MIGCGNHRFTISAIGNDLAVQILDPKRDCSNGATVELEEIKFENFFTPTNNGWTFVAIAYDHVTKSLSAFNDNGLFRTKFNVKISRIETELIGLGVANRDGMPHYLPQDMSLSCVSVYGVALSQNELMNIQCRCKHELA